MHTQFETETPSGTQPIAARRGFRALLVSVGIVFSLSFAFFARPGVAHAAWIGFARMMQFGSHRTDAEQQTIMRANLATLRPQQQAEFLLEAAVNHSDAATAQIMMRADSWHGRLSPTPQLLGLLNTALNSDDIKVRAAALESELAVGNLAKDPASPKVLVARIHRQPAALPWALWMLGALGNRGVEPDRTYTTLIKYTHDQDENARYWAVEGLGLIGNDQSVSTLLDILRNDPSAAVRERAASGLAQSGMLSKQQRMTAVPTLIDYASDPSLDANTHTLVYRALDDITGATVGNNSAALRKYWAAASSH